MSIFIKGKKNLITIDQYTFHQKICFLMWCGIVVFIVGTTPYLLTSIWPAASDTNYSPDQIITVARF